jgi:excisionase family DNA binding protein
LQLFSKLISRSFQEVLQGIPRTPPITKTTGAWENRHVAQTSDTKNKKTMNTNDNKSVAVEPLVCTVEDTARLLNCSTKTVRRLIIRGYFAPCKALRKILIPRQQIEAFLKATCGTPKTLL